ncbi:hypothetical protein FRC12_006619, partial [Ceratobasidium sp. 428]
MNTISEVRKDNHKPKLFPGSCSSFAAVSTLPDILANWKATRTLLTTAIQDYLASCATLITACSTPVCQPSGKSVIERVLADIDLEFESLAFEESSLRNMRMSLLTTRNKSATLVPINKLPPEILAGIFTLSNSCYTSSEKRNLHNFTSVCAYWRDIATSVADPWTHVDIGPLIPRGFTQLLLDRSKNSPIYVHLYESTPNLASASPDREVFDVIEALAPHAHRIYAIDLESHSHSRTLFHPVLNLWLSGGTPSLAKSLTVYRPNASVLLSPNESSMDAFRNYSANAHAMLLSLETLRLQNVKFDLGSLAYRGLVDLQLGCFCAWPSTFCISQLERIISASPKLATLKLDSIAITSPDDWVCPPPIVLNQLQTLSLSHMDPTSLRLLLPLLTSPCPLAKVAIGPTD